MSGSSKVKICLVYKTGGDYVREDVEILRGMIQTHVTVPYELLLLTDDSPEEIGGTPLLHDWPGWWSKMEMFRPDIEGDIFYMDLDTVLVGNIDPLVQAGETTVLTDFYKPHGMGSGVMYLAEEDRRRIWEAWIGNPEGIIKTFRGDQDFIGTLLGLTAKRWQNTHPDQVVSYKCHVRRSRNYAKRFPGPAAKYRCTLRKSVLRFEVGTGRLPRKARVVCFHGQPRPRDVGWLRGVKT